jgi:hypothetical protein
LSLPVFELPKSKVEIRKSIPKSKEDIDVNVSIPKLSLPKGDMKVDLNLKKDRKNNESSSSSSSSDEHKKKKGSFELNIDGKFEIPKFDKPEIKGDLSIPVFEFTISKVEIRKSISKSKEGIDVNVSIPKLSPPKGDVKVDLNLKKDSSSSNSDDKKKKKGGIDINIDGKSKTLKFEKPEIR